MRFRRRKKNTAAPTTTLRMDATVRAILFDVGWPTHICTERGWIKRADPMCPMTRAEHHLLSMPLVRY